MKKQNFDALAFFWDKVGGNCTWQTIWDTWSKTAAGGKAVEAEQRRKRIRQICHHSIWLELLVLSSDASLLYNYIVL